MNLFKSLVLLGALSVSANLFAQDIKAVLVDSRTAEPVGFATVSITAEGQKEPYKYTLSDENGNVTISSVSNGTYTLKAELLGYKEYTSKVKVEGSTVDLGKIKMASDAKQLDAATVAAVGNTVVIKKDTIEYNATAFSTTDNDVLEDLLKKLPGVEVSDDGTITANGETITKITIDGKTFFLDDPQLASKNIPAKVVNKLKIIQKKSEQAEFTGIDDGEEETVIDLSVQPGMLRGLFGNVLGGIGRDVPTDDDTEAELRFRGNAFMGRFSDNSQISVILNGNNVNNQGGTNRAGNMMMNMRSSGIGGSGEGITTSYMAGINGAFDLFDDNMEMGGNYLFNSSDNVAEQSSVKTTYLEDYNLRYNSSGVSDNHSDGHRFGIRLDHKFSDNTSILFQPQINFGRGWYSQASNDTTYNDDLAGNVTKLSESYSNNSGDNKSVSTEGFFLFRQRLGIPGRTLTVFTNYDISTNNLTGINNNGTYSYDTDGITITEEEIVNQSFDNREKSYSVRANATYTEPLGNYFYVQASYAYNWSKSTSDKETIDLYTGEINYTYSNNIINESNRQEMGVNLLFQNGKVNVQLGFSAMPTRTRNTTTRSGETVDYDDFRWNFSPQLATFLNFSDFSSMRMFYRGTSSQPSTSQLIPVPDNSDPMNVSLGNPSLTPYFTHSLRGDYRYTNKEKYASLNVRFNGSYVQNPIVNAILYDTSSGAQYSMPFNGRSSLSGNVRTFANIPLGQSGFSINNFLNASYSQSSSYVGSNITMDTSVNDDYYAFMEEFSEKFNDGQFYENSTQTLSANERLRLRYSGTTFDATLGASTRMNRSWYTISNTADQTTTWNNAVSGSLTWNWASPGISIEGEYNYRWYMGYSTEQPSENVLNMEVSKLLFNDKITLALRGYDILGQSKNITVSDNSNYHSEVTSNTLGRYVIVSLTWRFGSMGNNQMRGMGGPGGHGGGPGGPPPGR